MGMNFRYLQKPDISLPYLSQGKEAWTTIPGERVLQYSEDGELWRDARNVPIVPSSRAD